MSWKPVPKFNTVKNSSTDDEPHNYNNRQKNYDLTTSLPSNYKNTKLLRLLLSYHLVTLLPVNIQRDTSFPTFEAKLKRLHKKS